MTSPNPDVSRRRARVAVSGVALAMVVGLVALVAGLLPATGADPSPDDVQPEVLGVVTSNTASTTTPATSTTAPSTTTTAPSTTTTMVQRPGVRYEATSNEVQRAAKQLGVDIVHQLTNYEAGTTGAQIAAAITADPEGRSELAAMTRPLHHDGHWSRGEVTYGQLGGLTTDKTSIMVVVDQQVGLGADVTLAESRTIDVRLELIDGVWTFDRIAHAGGERMERPADLSPEAAAVVDDPRIVLADSARWDIYRGHTSPVLLRLMADLADVTPYAAVVLSNGHPYHVFETDRVSNHSVGRAIDIYLLGDTRVIDGHDPDSPIHQVVTWAYDRPEVREVGSPWALDGAGGRSFTNEVHHDHVHIGVHRPGVTTTTAAPAPTTTAPAPATTTTTTVVQPIGTTTAPPAD